MAIPRSDCKCEGCQGLRDRYPNDIQLRDFYRRKLLQRGWAGQRDKVERTYQRVHASWYTREEEESDDTEETGRENQDHQDEDQG